MKAGQYVARKRFRRSNAGCETERSLAVQNAVYMRHIWRMSTGRLVIPREKSLCGRARDVAVGVIDSPADVAFSARLAAAATVSALIGLGPAFAPSDCRSLNINWLYKQETNA